MHSVKILLTLLLNIILLLNIESARILAVFPTPSISHQVAFRPLVHALAKRGHDVTVLTTDPAFPRDKAPENLTEIDVHDLSYAVVRGVLDKYQGVKEGFIQHIREIFENIAIIFEKQMHVAKSVGLFSQKFDLLIVEAYVRPTLALAHVFDAPIIQISSLGAGPPIYGLFGAPTHPLLYPSPAAQRLYNLTIIEKAQVLIQYYVLEYIISTTVDFDYEVLKRTFGDNVPKYEELERNVQLLFLNEHPIWADNHPAPPNIVYIGGIHQTPDKKLPEEFKNILDSSKHGVIYVSFGTNVKPSILPPERIAVMTKVLSQLPYDVLWKWDKDELPGQSSNIKIYKWFPQSDLLKHPKVKLFITQGGIQSADEAIDAAVPLIGMPMLGDQWYNIEKYVHHGVGLQLDINEITEATFKSAVETVINDKRFKKNMLRLRTLMREYPIPPLDLAVWWVEHILKYGGSHLRSPAAGVYFVEYYEVPLVLSIGAVLATILIVFALVSLCTYRCLKSVLCKSPRTKKQKIIKIN